MSDTAVEEPATEVEDVPEEVVALDGIASEEEAHNVERPARGSGIHKHKDGEKSNRIELKDLEVGSEVDAKVKTITSYGAFLDIGAKSDANDIVDIAWIISLRRGAPFWLLEEPLW